MEVKEREKALIKNTGILALGSLSSKIFSFFLLPLYTTALSTADYGTIDVLQTVTMLVVPFASLQLSSAVFRFIIEADNEKKRKEIITSAFIIELISTLLFIIVFCIINYIKPITYFKLFIIYFGSIMIIEFVQNTIRGFGYNGIYSIMSVLMTIASAVMNIIMILCMGIKGESILIASSISSYLGSIIVIIYLKLWRYVSLDAFSKQYLKRLFKYCLPLIPNSISWWITNASDRLIVRGFLGSSFNGIYAAANKIPTVYTNFFNVYNLAWTEAVARSQGDKKQSEFLNSMFKKSLKLFGCINLGIICGMSLMFTILIGQEYKQAYPQIYILMIAIFISSICSIYGGILTGYKMSKTIGITTVVGAIVNIIINN